MKSAESRETPYFTAETRKFHFSTFPHLQHFTFQFPTFNFPLDLWSLARRESSTFRKDQSADEYQEEQQLGAAVHAHRYFHVGRREGTVVTTDVGLGEEHSEIVVRTAEATVENAC
jgi:hypothetical protein